MLHNSATWLLKTFAIILFISSCVQKETKEYRLITAKDDLGIFNLTRFHRNFYFYADSAGTITMPVKNGDLLDIWKEDNGILLRCTPDFPDSFQLRVKNDIIYMNDKLTGLRIPNSLDSPQLFRKLKNTDFKNLKTLIIGDYIPDAYLPFVDSIAKINPDIDLHIYFSNEENSDIDSLNKIDSVIDKHEKLNYDSLEIVFRKNIKWLSERFNPFLIAYYGSTKELKQLEVFNSVQTITLEINEFEKEDTLPHFPSLKKLVIANDADSLIIPRDFLMLNPKLEELMIQGNFNPGLLNWKSLNKLQALRIVSDSISSYPYGQTLPGLQTFLISGKGHLPEENILSFKNLKELSIPCSTPQNEFDNIIKAFPHLYFLQIGESDTLLVKDYSALKKSMDLRYLIISGKNGKANSLYPLKRLKYLSLHSEFFDDSLQVNALKKALPDTVIEPNEGLCMGSGWLLFLVPLVALGVFAGKKYLSKAA